MPERFVGEVHEFAGNKRKMIGHDGRDIVVFERGGRFYAFDNTCLHMGGPVGEGILIGKVEAVLDENKCFVREEFSKKEIHLVCPWHGWEYDIETGVCAGDRGRRLTKYETIEREGKIYVRS